MDIDAIRKLIDLVGTSPIDELELARDGWRIRIVKARNGFIAPDINTEIAEHIVKGVPSTATRRHIVKAPFPGTFYQSLAEGEPPLVSLGDIVEDGQKLCLLEAMKTFNIIEADRAGRIVELPVTNGSSVQAGDPLIIIEAVT